MPELSGKNRKITAFLIGAVSAALFILTLILGAVSVSRNAYGYYRAFGTASVIVQNDMMNGDGDVALEVGELASFDILNSREKAEILRGDVVLVEKENGTEILRVVSKTFEGAATVYLAKSDRQPYSSAETVSPDKIIGKYLYKSAVNGAFFAFSSTFGGFVVCYVLPAALALAGGVFCIVVLFFYGEKYTNHL